jgi:hypothetical protein
MTLENEELPPEAENDPLEGDDDSILKQKYDELTRQIFPQKIELPISALATMVASQINLAPDFQRRDVWDEKKQSKFIESLIMNVPIPPVFLGEDAYGKYVVLDGRQRLTALVRYLKNEYALSGLKVWSELNGDRFTDLERKKLDVSLTRRFLPAVVLLKESSPEVKYDVFERLNTGGLNLNAMEIRNAVYRGQFTDLLHSCASSKAFRALWGIPGDAKAREKNLMYMRMLDLEQVLRFFALSAAQVNKESRPAFKTYLGHFMAMRNDDYLRDDGLERLDRDSFDRATGNCFEMLGKDAFERDGPTSAPLADALMYALEPYDNGVRTDPKVVQAVREARWTLLETPEFVECLGQGTNGKAKIEKRLDLARDAMAAAIGNATAR